MISKMSKKRLVKKAIDRDGKGVYFNTVNSAELLSKVSKVRRFLHPPGRMF